MSRTVNGSTAQAALTVNKPAAIAQSARTLNRFNCFCMKCMELTQKPGDIIKQGNTHHAQQDCNTTALQPLHPDVRYASTGCLLYTSDAADDLPRVDLG